VRSVFIFLFWLPAIFGYSQTDTLYANYISKVPFVSNENGKIAGIDVDIVTEYSAWLKAKKNQNLFVKFVPFPDENSFYAATKSANKNTIGIGALVNSTCRAKEIDVTGGYLKNVAFCITNGNAPDIKTKTAGEVMKTLGSMTGLTIPASSLANYMAELKKLYLNDLKVKEMSDQTKMLDEVAKNVLNFTYVDAVIFWFYLKSNPQKFLKMQKPLSQDKEQLCFIVPKGSQHKALFNEFFAGAAGFKTQKNYRVTLEKYLGSYMTQNMAIN
jgi:ABC-type amino acid transport substrate-binding protein